ncbi:MAG TPA: hypothetical protein DIC19_06090 [Erysipelotrichaceae bacterium]|nr:hypothetical protein [Erysipelotrichaceae bacterium]
MHKRIFLKALLVSILFLNACSSGSVEDGFSYEKKVGIDDTATLGELDKSQWELNLSKDSFDMETELSMDVLSEEDAQAIAGDFQLLSAPVSLNVKESDGIRLSTPATIKVKIPETYTGPYSSLFMGYLTDEGWEYFTPDTIDLENGIAYATLYHFSTYAFGAPSEQDQIATYAQKVAASNWVKSNNHADLIEATKNQYDDMFLQMGIENTKLRNQFVVDMVSYLEDASQITGDVAPIDALVQMANAASQGEEGKQAFMEKFVEFTGKAMARAMESDPGTFGKAFTSVLSLQKIAKAVESGDDEEALKGLGSLLKAVVPQTQIVETMVLYTVDKARQTIEYWTAEELEKAYQAYIGNGNGKYSFTDDRDFDLIFTTLGGGQRMNEIYIINKWCEARKIDPNTLGQAARDQIVEDAYTALKAHFDLRKVKDPEIKELEMDEQAFIDAMIKEGLMDPTLYKESWGSDNKYNPTQRLDQLYRLKNTVLNLIDPEVAKTLTPSQIAKIMNQWLFHTKDNNRKGFYQYLKDLGYLRKVEANAEYAWVYLETVIYDGKAQIDATNANGVYSNSGEAKPGSYTYTWKYLGEADDYYDPDLLAGEGATITGTNSEPPKVIRGGEVVSLSLNISIGDHLLSYFTANGAISADIDAFDVAAGGTTNAYDDFVNAINKSTFTVDTYETVQRYSDGDTVTATMPTGSEPTEPNTYQKIAIRVSFSSSAIMGANYIYEWKPVE